MKQTKFWAGLAAALMVIAAVLGSLLSAVDYTAGLSALYGVRSRAAAAELLGGVDDDAVTAYIGLTAEEQQSAADQLAAYMQNGVQNQKPQVTIVRDGQEVSLLNERETLHLADVQALIAKAKRIATGLISLSGALAVVIAWLSAQEKRGKQAALGALIGACVLLALGGIAALLVKMGGFGNAFVAMHRMLFANDLWLMDPQTDLLIRMMPQNLFEGAAKLVLQRTAATGAMLLAMLAAVYVIVRNLIRNQLKQNETKA